MAIDPEVLDDRPADPEFFAAHRRLLRAWRDAGALVEDADGDALWNRVQQLPQPVRKMWQKARTRHRIVPVAGPLDLAKDDVCLAALESARDVELACVTDARATRLGVAPTEMRRPVGSAGELCRYRFADQSSHIQAALEQARALIVAGTPSNEVWRDRFKPLLRLTRQSVVVVDRYCLAAYERAPEACGLAALLRGLEADASAPLNLQVFASWDERGPGPAVRALAALWTQCAPTKVRDLELCGGNEPAFGRLHHGRYVRFDKTVCELDTGLEVLEPPAVRRVSAYRMELFDRIRTDIEGELRQQLTRFVVPARAPASAAAPVFA